MTLKKDERTLLIELREARKRRDELEEALSDAKRDYNEKEASLIEAIQAKQAEATAKYEGLGFARIAKPRLYASYKKENEEKIFALVTEDGRDDLIKPSIHPSSLSGYVSERIGSGKSIPEEISYYFKTSIRLY